MNEGLKSVVATALISGFTFAGGITSAHAKDLQIALDGFDDNGASGTVRVAANSSGPDGFALKVQGLEAGETYTVFLAHQNKIGALPVHFVGQFDTDDSGRGNFSAETEVLNAFAIHNDGREDAAGEFAGAIGEGATTVALNHVRIYDGEDVHERVCNWRIAGVGYRERVAIAIRARVRSPSARSSTH